jgi:hypothetical protein
MWYKELLQGQQMTSEKFGFSTNDQVRKQAGEEMV